MLPLFHLRRKNKWSFRHFEKYQYLRTFITRYNGKPLPEINQFFYNLVA